MDPVIVMEPAAPSLQLEFEEGPGTENNLDAVVFEKWGRNAIDVVVKSKNLDWRAVAEKNKALVEGTTAYAKLLLCDLPGDRVIFLMIWPPHAFARIHGHPGVGCVLSLLHGKLKETRYVQNEEQEPTIILPGTGSKFISDDIAFHKMENIYDDWSFSLHLYEKV